jgi:hypothetical protein
VGDFAVFLRMSAIQNLLHPLPDLTRDERLMIPLLDMAGIVKLPHIDALPQNLVEGSDRYLIPRDPKANSFHVGQELGITWIAAHSPQAKGSVERGFQTAQDRLVKGMRVAEVKTMEQANHYLETEFLPWVNNTLAVAPANADDAHRPLEKHHDLAPILSHVEQRRATNDYTFSWNARIYPIARKDVCTGLPGAFVRVEERREALSPHDFGSAISALQSASREARLQLSAAHRRQSRRCSGRPGAVRPVALPHRA